MERGWWGKFFLLLFCTVAAGIYVWPTFSYHVLGKTVSEESAFPFKKTINLGLDLQGGLYMVLGVDFNKIYRGVMDQQSASLRDRLKDRGYPLTQLELQTEGFDADDPRVRIEFEDKNKEEVRKTVKEEYEAFRVTEEGDDFFQLGTARDYRGVIREKTIEQSIEVIRNRIDEFGVTEPSIVSQGTDRIVVELPGETDAERAKNLIGRTAKLTFKIVDRSSEVASNLPKLIAEIEEENSLKFESGSGKFSEYVEKLNQLAQKRIPAGTEIVFQRVNNQAGAAIERIPYLLDSKVSVDGKLLQNAYVSVNPQNQRPEVAFEFNPKGASEFAKLTGANIGKELAIVLDANVVSAPTIQAEISNRGVITLGSGNQDDLYREASDLSIVLRAGALPAKLEFLEQRVVGPSLGQDSIKKSASASILGALAIFIFIAIYYRMSGVIAVVSLVLNVVFVVAILVGLDATLTLPGIAGIGLTVGIAVDSNVIIYERIREEIRNGKTLFGAVESGFQKAFRTIFDANITNAAGALVLLSFGTGPIRGFAITLLIGIITTLFTAVFVCKLVFAAYTRKLELKGQGAVSI